MPAQRVTVAKFGGSALGVNGERVPRVVERLRTLGEAGRVVAVFSAPLVKTEAGAVSVTDLALQLGAAWAAGEPAPVDPLFAPYLVLADRYLTGAERAAFDSELARCRRRTEEALVHSRELRRFHDLPRARVLAYAGEYLSAVTLGAVLRAHGLDCGGLPFAQWPIVTDEVHEGAQFLPEESRDALGPLREALERHACVTVGGFIGRTAGGLETTFERGGSDRSAVVLGILLSAHGPVAVDFEKDGPVYSADPRLDRRSLEHVEHLSYAEARTAATFGMKILDPVAVRELEDSGLDLPLVITDLERPEVTTALRRVAPRPPNPMKIVTGRGGCALVRMEQAAASHLVFSLLHERRYADFVVLSPFTRGSAHVARILFLDADYLRRHEKVLRAYDPKAERTEGLGVVTVVGDELSRVRGLVPLAAGALGEAAVGIRGMDFQEEPPRLLILVDDAGGNVAKAVRAIHARRTTLHPRDLGA